MEEHKTDRDLLAKGLKKMGIALGLIFLGPTLIHIAFSNQEKPLYIPILILGIISCCAAIYFVFKGINTIMDSMFKKQSNLKKPS